MSLRSNGSYIGPRPTGPVGAYNGAASGIWDLRTAQRQQAAGTWPTTTFTPDVLTGLQLWLDASDASTLYDATSGGSLVAADGGVARWEDKSGNGRHATQGTSANRPVRKSSVQNGLDFLRFDGTNDSLTIGAVSAFDMASTTQFAVALVPAVPPGGTTSDRITNHEYASGAASNNNIFSGFIYSASGGLFFSARQSSGTIATIDTADRPIPTANAAFVLTGRYSPGGVDTILNGGEVISAAVSVVTPSGHIGTQIGRRAGDIDYLNGDIAEILIYDSALSDTDREAVENYLMAKWGIS